MMSTKIPVLTESTQDGEVLGWATGRVGAMRVILRAARDCGVGGVFDAHIEGDITLSFDPGIHRDEHEVRRVNAIGRAWILEYVSA